MKKIFCITALFCAVFLFGCTEKVSVSHTRDDSILLNVQSSPGKSLDAMISSLMKGVNHSIDKDEAEVAVVAHGGNNVSVQTEGKAGFSLDATFSAKKKNALSPLFEISADGKTFSLTLSKETITQFLSLLPEDAIEYTELLIAPVFTGEKMSVSEYLDTLSAVYGEESAKEMKEAKIEFSITSKSGVKQTLNIPLSDILTLQQTKQYTFDW